MRNLPSTAGLYLLAGMFAFSMLAAVAGCASPSYDASEARVVFAG